MDSSAVLEPSWSLDRITDDTYRQKFTDVPLIIQNWMAPHGGLHGKEILDFGCGEASSAMGIALQYQAARVVGIDIMSDPDLCLPLAQQQLGLQELPPNLSLHQVKPGQMHDPEDQFDLIYSWSVFEHVEQTLLATTLEQLRGMLKPGGNLMIQIAPLYFSAEGSHLNPWIPEPWGHLVNQHSRYRAKLAACTDEARFRLLWSTYSTLNRITAPQLIAAVHAAGFTLSREYFTTDKREIPEVLQGVYTEEVLRTDQVVLLATPNDSLFASK
jgi:SAM-dependent methyltransferase